MNQSERHELYRRFEAANPAPRSELVYQSPFELLVAVMLSAQSTDRQVNRITQPLFAEANTPEALHALGIDGLAHRIRSIGLFRTKAKHVHATCKILLDQHDGQVPASRADLEALPGVGRKTANVVLNVAFGAPTLAVDTHIFRVSNRLGLAKGRTPLAVEKALLKVTPERYLLNAHHWLILHGRYTCTARQPRCTTCLVSDLCATYQRTKRQGPAS